MTTAGGSARREYERRRAREAARRRSNRTLRLAVTLATPFVVYGTVRLAAPLANDAWRSYVEEATSSDRPARELVDSSMANLVGLLLAVVATLNVITTFWGRRQSTEAWGKGADGEERTGRLLARLPSEFVVCHDLSIPGSRANIDHVVIGPTGLFTIETKSYRGGVTINRGTVRSGGRRREGVAAQAAGQARVVAARTGRPVRSLVVVHGGVDVGWFSTPVVDGVRFCSPKRLVKVIRAGAGSLTAEEVADAATSLSEMVR